MTSDQAIAFFLFAVVAAITPGPSNTMILATGTQAGLLRGLPCALGAATGMGTLLFASALGLGQIILAFPALIKTLNIAGAVFLIWLAIRIAYAGPVKDNESKKPVGFLEATLFQWINPKGWLVAVSAAGTYLQATSSSTLFQAFAFGGVFFAAALPCGLIWLATGGALHKLLRDERYATIFNEVMAFALIVSVLIMLR